MLNPLSEKNIILDASISDLSKIIMTPIGHAILNSIKDQRRRGMNQHIIAFDLVDDTITVSSQNYGGRAIVAEYKEVAKKKYEI